MRYRVSLMLPLCSASYLGYCRVLGWQQQPKAVSEGSAFPKGNEFLSYTSDVYGKLGQLSLSYCTAGQIIILNTLKM